LARPRHDGAAAGSAAAGAPAGAAHGCDDDSA